MYAVVCDRCGKIPKLAYNGVNSEEIHFVELNTTKYNYRGDRTRDKTDIHLCEECRDELCYSFLGLEKE